MPFTAPTTDEVVEKGFTAPDSDEIVKSSEFHPPAGDEVVVWNARPDNPINTTDSLQPVGSPFGQSGLQGERLTEKGDIIPALSGITSQADYDRLPQATKDLSFVSTQEYRQYQSDLQGHLENARAIEAGEEAVNWSPLKNVRFQINEGEPAAVTYGKEAANVLMGVPQFLTSPVGVALGAAGAAAPRLVSGLFSADMLNTLGHQVHSAYKNWDTMTDTQKRVAMTDMAGTGAFAYLTGAHALKGEAAPIDPVVERQAIQGGLPQVRRVVADPVVEQLHAANAPATAEALRETTTEAAKVEPAPVVNESFTTDPAPVGETQADEPVTGETQTAAATDESEQSQVESIGNAHSDRSVEQEQSGGTRQWNKAQAEKSGQSVEDFYAEDKAKRDAEKVKFRAGLKNGDVFEVSSTETRVDPETKVASDVKIVKRFRVTTDPRTGRMEASPEGRTENGVDVGTGGMTPSGLEPDSGMHFFNELNSDVQGGEIVQKKFKVIRADEPTPVTTDVTPQPEPISNAGEQSSEVAPQPQPEPAAASPAPTQAETPAAKAKQLADKLRSLKVDVQREFTFAFPHPEAIKAIGSNVWNGSVEIAAQIVEAGGSVKNAIEAAINHLRENADGFSEAKARANLNSAFGETDIAESTPQTYGIAQRVSDKMTGEGRIGQIEPGEGISTEDSVARGRQLLNDGKDPDAVIEQFQKDNKVSADDMAVVRARGEQLSKAAKDAAEKHGINSDESRAAGQALTDWQKKIKPLQTEWAKIGQAQQGETDVDTGTFHGLREAFIRDTGKDFTPEQAVEAQRKADAVQAAQREADAARDAVVRQANGEADTASTTFPAHVLRVAERIVQAMEDRADKATARLKAKLRTTGSLVDPTILKDVVEIGAAKLARKSMDFAEWSMEMGKHFGDLAKQVEPYLEKAFKLSQEYDVEKEGVAKFAKGEGEKVKRAIKDKADSGASERELQRQKSALETSIAEKQKQLETGDVEARKRPVNRPANPELETLKQQRDDLNKQLQEARKKPDDVKEAKQLESKLRDLNNRIAEKQAKIDKGDTSANPQRANRPMPPELEQARQKLDALNQRLDEMRNGPKSPDTIDDVRQQFKDYKPGSKFTPEQVKTLWNAAKKFYLDKGVTDFDDLRHGLATDLGMSVEDVTRGLAQPKGAKRLTNELYAKMSNQRRVVNAAKQWLENQKSPKWARAASAIPRLMFAAKVFGHGTVGMITHAGNVMFNPTAIKPYWINFFRQFKLMGLHDQGAFHERMMQDLVRDPNYITARRAGLANDPTRYQDDYQTPDAIKFFKKIGLSGNRGFDALKLLRQARFNQAWDSLPESLKTPEMAKMIADAKNHESGIITSSLGKPGKAANLLMFAPKLEGSRWAFAIGDPAKAAATFFDWKNSTPEAKQAAISEAKQKAAIAGMYFSALAFNQAMLSATGSNENVNFTNPKRGDFLSFKVAGHAVGIIKPLTGVLRLFANLTHDTIGTRESWEKRNGRFAQFSDDLGEYARGKASPFAGPALDVAFQADYIGRPMPYSDEPVPPRLAKFGITTPYSYGEYTAKTLLPIPAQEAVTEVWKHQGMNDHQVKVWTEALIKAAAMGGTGARVTEDYYSD
jgi:hypothetical protein